MTLYHVHLRHSSLSQSFYNKIIHTNIVQKKKILHRGENIFKKIIALYAIDLPS